MIYFYSKTISESYEEILSVLKEEPDFIVSPRGQEVKEIRDCAIEIKDPMENLYINEHRSSPLKYISAELLWYFSGTNNPIYIEQYASMWKYLHNIDGTVNSAYGNLLFSEKNEYNLTQYQWVIETLKKDKESRQAFMHFNKPHHQFFENKDQVCTLQSLFHIRNEHLYMTLTMRSNDIIYGFMTDWAFFSILFYHVYLSLKEFYPNLKLGSYTHISHSMHLYKKHYDLIDKMLTSKFYSNSIPLLNKPLLNIDGSIKNEYEHILEPIKQGKNPDYNKTTDNDLINWCFEHLK